jgi:hypothetical protein
MILIPVAKKNNFFYQLVLMSLSLIHICACQSAYINDISVKPLLSMIVGDDAKADFKFERISLFLPDTSVDIGLRCNDNSFRPKNIIKKYFIINDSISVDSIPLLSELECKYDTDTTYDIKNKYVQSKRKKIEHSKNDVELRLIDNQEIQIFIDEKFKINCLKDFSVIHNFDFFLKNVTGNSHPDLIVFSYVTLASENVILIEVFEMSRASN